MARAATGKGHGDVTYEVHDHADMLGHIGDLAGALVLGILYQIGQTYLGLIEAGDHAAVPVTPQRALLHLGIFTLPLLVYAFFVLRAALLLRRVQRPSTIAYTRKVLWLAGPGIIVSTWVIQAILYRTWPMTPAAWLVIACVVLKLRVPMPLLTIVALVQAIALAWLWNLFLTRYGKVRELYSDPNGPDWGDYLRELKARRREEARKQKARDLWQRNYRMEGL